MRRIALYTLLFGMVLQPRSGWAEDAPELTTEDHKHFNPIAEGAKQAESFTLYEGLPHQMWEAKLLKQELAARETLKIHGYPFYKRPLQVDPKDAQRLRQLVTTPASYWSFRGEKLCGGYHPDYCLTWRSGESAYHFLICFGCHEMKLVGPNQNLRVDIRTEPFKSMNTTLKKYHDQRPKSK